MLPLPGAQGVTSAAQQAGWMPGKQTTEAGGSRGWKGCKASESQSPEVGLRVQTYSELSAVLGAKVVKSQQREVSESPKKSR